ncbi:unnamed protein product [Caenorhabditis auriculariae]|uniref:BPTI/Kunitz inhibitor domain-containing protein n=1 Tax=Caenorhabditis auriculariae TaxID=2777116 RepID=A0A8S1H440_9PELO|nr:unnamed protein product [Caenorhabditis auriculariae]
MRSRSTVRRRLPLLFIARCRRCLLLEEFVNGNDFKEFRAEMNPGENGCMHDEQCDAVWPTTRCRQGACRCAVGEKISRTREGAVCHLPGQCPTNGVFGALYERTSNDLASCTFVDAEKKTFIGCDEYPEVYDCVDGVCCPSRGLTCSLPMDEGEDDVSPSESFELREQRWFHNSASRACQPFVFSGSGGNANNFRSKIHCESYCLRRCERGDPSAISDCATSQKPCDENYECALVANKKHFCCPTAAFICSAPGGVTISKFESSPFSVGSSRLGKEPTLRWFWDTASLTCHTFKFNGQGGNFNNFQTKSHCTDFCAKSLCAWSSALRDPSDDVQRCSSEQRCPATHECHHTVCCPKPSTVCTQPLVKGEDCGFESSTRWFFDSAAGLCRPFEFSGCGGNDNNFPNSQTCQQICDSVRVEATCPQGKPYVSSGPNGSKCSKDSVSCPPNFECMFFRNSHTCCPTKQNVCSQVLAPGMSCGDSPTTKWYFDANQGKCRPFEFLGCEGNDNNFDSPLLCSEMCETSECADGGEALVDESTGSTIVCGDNGECPSTHRCSQLMRSRRMGCCPSRQFICSQTMTQGESCGSPSKRFFFDAKQQVCLQFDFKGCNGNGNNFATRLACYHFCLSAACSSSETVYQASNADSPFDCTLQSCPRGYSCVRDAWDSNKAVCCGASNLGICPSEQHPMLEPRTQQPTDCVPNKPESCPPDFQCIFNDVRNQHFCCRTINRIEKCPKGGRVSTWTATAEPVGCVVDEQCPDQAQCYSPVVYSLGLCCSSTDDVCPPTFTYEREKSERKECSPLDRNSCSIDRQSICLLSERLDRFVCCRREVRLVNAIEKCPRGSVFESQRITCDPETPCPSTHFCVKRVSDRTGICCRHPKIAERKRTTRRYITTTAPKSSEPSCPTGQFPLSDATGYMACDLLNECPKDYKCTIQKNGLKTCCGKHVNDVCENGASPLPDSQGCDDCPIGYVCQNEYCCPDDDFSCSSSFEIGKTCSREATSKRFYFDAGSATCRPFTFGGCDGNANNFFTREACLSTCVRRSLPEIVPSFLPDQPAATGKFSPVLAEQINCPKPLQNPKDHPQMCVVERKSCSENEKCVATASGTFVCCVQPPTLRVFMRNMCGSKFIPKFDMHGDVQRCRTHAECAKNHVCRRNRRAKFSPTSPYSEGEEKCPDGSPECTTPRFYPGDKGCLSDSQCHVSSECVDNVCICRNGNVQFHRMCTSVCPPYHRNVSGVCV